MHPSAMETNLKKLGKLRDYTLERPKPVGREAFVANYVEAGEILRNNAVFAPDYARRAQEVIKGKG